jgi:hypothetical protein
MKKKGDAATSYLCRQAQLRLYEAASGKKRRGEISDPHGKVIDKRPSPRNSRVVQL